jgi:enoyl-CoA hydratase/carnithine racemase
MVLHNPGVEIMELTKVEIQNGIAVLGLDNGTTNALNLHFLNVISRNLHEFRDDASINGLVITSSNEKFFSIGFDIPQLFESTMNEVIEFYKTFNSLCLELYTFPKPVIAAIIGHAIAGGCILAICCDYRSIAEGKKLMGLNEIKLGLPVPYPADCILTQLVGPQTAREMVYTGEFYAPDELIQLGLVDQVLPVKDVLLKSIEKAKSLGAMPHTAFSIIKRNRVELVEAQIKFKLAEKEQIFIERWQAEDTQKLLKEAIKKF